MTKLTNATLCVLLVCSSAPRYLVLDLVVQLSSFLLCCFRGSIERKGPNFFGGELSSFIFFRRRRERREVAW